MRVLVVGGAGYIGSHMVKLLGEQGIDVTTLDDLSSGHAEAVVHGELVEHSLAERDALDRLFGATRFDAVMHFASFIEVGESVRDPAKYYRNNVLNTQNLLEAMIEHGVGAFIFSSTAAIFGEPQAPLIDENHPKQPLNPYGRSKLMVEQMLADYDSAYRLRAICLRYFNAAGADPDGRLGERHDPETHLIPLVLQAAAGRRPEISIFGDDYATEDGTCVRDYIHVCDLCDAHLLALRQLADGAPSASYNLGNGSGFSVREVIEAGRRISGRNIPVSVAARRPGDPATLVADSSRARAQLGWQPRYHELDTIVEHAWRWESRSNRR